MSMSKLGKAMIGLLAIASIGAVAPQAAMGGQLSTPYVLNHACI